MPAESRGKDGKYDVDQVEYSPFLRLTALLGIIKSGERSEDVEEALEAIEAAKIVLLRGRRLRHSKVLVDLSGLLEKLVDVGICAGRGGGRGRS